MPDNAENTTDIVVRLRQRASDAGWPKCDLLNEAAGKIEELRVAAVKAAMPLEAMILGGTWRMHAPDVQSAIKVGAVAVREAIADV